MAVNYCRCQLAENWGEQHLPTIKRKVQLCILEFASLACSMTGILMSAFGVRVGTWNLGSLGGKGGEVCEELR